jgi:hypothetical protein
MEPHCFDNESLGDPSHLDIGQVYLWQGDLRNKDDLRTDAGRPARRPPLAADTRVMDSIDYPVHDFGTLKLSKACRKLRVQRIVAASLADGLAGGWAWFKADHGDAVGQG